MSKTSEDSLLADGTDRVQDNSLTFNYLLYTFFTRIYLCMKMSSPSRRVGVQT